MTTFQIRLPEDMTLSHLLDETAHAVWYVVARSCRMDVDGGERIALLEASMKEFLDRRVRAYDVCGLGGLCNEGVEPSQWSARPGTTTLLLESGEEYEELLAGFEGLILDDFAGGPMAPEERGSLRARIRGAVVGTLGKHLYRNKACGDCELLRCGTRVDPWRTPAGAGSFLGKGEEIMEKNETQRYQLRLAGGERLDDLFGKMLLRIREFLDGTPDWRARPPREESRLEGELRGVMSYYVTAYDLCGIKVSCFETADPVSWSAGPDPKLSGPLAWRDQRILQLEVKNGLDEFLSAMVAAVLRALCRDPARARQAKRMRGGLERVVKGVLGPRLFRSMDYGCDLCLVVTRVNPWDLDAVGGSPC